MNFQRGSPMTVAVFGTLRFPPERLVAVLPHLHTLVQATRHHDGCLAYDVAEDLFDKGLIRFSELWPSQALLDAHLKAPHIAPWRNVCREAGLLQRDFTAYDATGARKV
jgi:quinol monooxygenase YgiN